MWRNQTWLYIFFWHISCFLCVGDHLQPLKHLSPLWMQLTQCIKVIISLCPYREFARGLTDGPAESAHVAVPELRSGDLSAGGEGNGSGVCSCQPKPSRHTRSFWTSCCLTSFNRLQFYWLLYDFYFFNASLLWGVFNKILHNF